jgi:Beta-propeller repeat
MQAEKSHCYRRPCSTVMNFKPADAAARVERQRREGFPRLHIEGKPFSAAPGYFAVLTLVLCATLARGVCAQKSSKGEFSAVATIGYNSQSSDTPTAIVVDSKGNVFVAGVTEPYDLNGESDLATAEIRDLSRKDIFLARISSATNDVTWVMRTGTKSDDSALGIALDPTEKFIYIVGQTDGQFGSTRRLGQGDVFVLKFDVRPKSAPTRVWKSPVIIGTMASDHGTAIKVALDGSYIYVAGNTRGSLFGNNLGKSDAFLCRLNASDGTIEARRQFGTDSNDYARIIVLPKSSNEPIMIGVETYRSLGNYEIGNMNVFKLNSSDLSLLGSVLIKTFSRETMSSLITHSLFPGQVFVCGSSWLEQSNGWQISVKRISRSLNDLTNIGTQVVDLDEFTGPEFAVKVGSQEEKHEKASAMMIDPTSGSLLVAGTTTGVVDSSQASSSSRSQIVLLLLNPSDGSVSQSAQHHLASAGSFEDVAGMAIDSSDIILVGARANETTGVLHTVVETFGLPDSWRKLVQTPSPTPPPRLVPADGLGDRDNSADARSTNNMVMFIAIGGGVAGIIVIVFIVTIYVCCRKLGHRANAAKLVRDPALTRKSKNEPTVDVATHRRPQLPPRAARPPPSSQALPVR